MVRQEPPAGCKTATHLAQDRISVTVPLHLRHTTVEIHPVRHATLPSALCRPVNGRGWLVRPGPRRPPPHAASASALPPFRPTLDDRLVAQRCAGPSAMASEHG